MFDINARMEQWSAANHAHTTTELTKSLQSPSEQPGTEPISKSASILARTAPFRKSKKTPFDINGRIDAWNASEDAMDSKVHQNLVASSPFKRNDEQSQAVQMLSEVSPELVMDMIEMCLEKLESMTDKAESEDAPQPDSESPQEEKDETPKEDDSKESDEKEDKAGDDDTSEEKDDE